MVLDDSGSVLVSFEVRDKPVNNEDLYHLVRKANDCKVSKVVCIAISSQQKALDIAEPVKWAEEREVMLRVFFDWNAFIGNALLWSKLPFKEAAKDAHQRIFKRLREVEASKEALEIWMI